MKFFLLLLLLTSNVFADEATVIKIFDGDTILVNNQGEHQIIRFLGIDTPEVSMNSKLLRDSERTKQDTSKIMRMGRISKEYLESLISPGEKVRLEYDVNRNNGNRILAFVYDQAGDMLNLKLIESGYATTMIIPPNVKYEEIFRKAQTFARKEKKGHWDEQ